MPPYHRSHVTTTRLASDYLDEAHTQSAVKQRRTGASSSKSSSEAAPEQPHDIKNLNWKKLTEVLWACMLPHISRMAEASAYAEEYNLANPPSPGTSMTRAFVMPWKEICEEFVQITGTNVSRRNIQARGRTLVSKRHKGEKRHRWTLAEDAELLQAISGVKKVYLERGNAPLVDMDDREKNSFWSMVYCTIQNVKRTKKSMRARFRILESHRAGDGSGTSSSSGSDYTASTFVKSEADAYMPAKPSNAGIAYPVGESATHTDPFADMVTVEQVGVLQMLPIDLSIDFYPGMFDDITFGLDWF